jgi:hypothetical protein
MAYWERAQRHAGHRVTLSASRRSAALQCANLLMRGDGSTYFARLADAGLANGIIYACYSASAGSFVVSRRSGSLLWKTSGEPVPWRRSHVDYV